MADLTGKPRKQAIAIALNKAGKKKANGSKTGKKKIKKNYRKA